MSKRMQELKREEIIVAKSESKVMNLSATVYASSSSAKDPIASKGPVKLIASGKMTTGEEEIQNPTQRRVLKEAARCIPWRVDG